VTGWILAGVVLVVFHTLCYFEATNLIGMYNCILCFLIFVKMILACQNAENEGELVMLSAQLKDMKIKYNPYGLFALNFPNLCSVIGLCYNCCSVLGFHIRTIMVVGS
jgi:hypothetical protein